MTNTNINRGPIAKIIDIGNLPKLNEGSNTVMFAPTVKFLGRTLKARVVLHFPTKYDHGIARQAKIYWQANSLPETLRVALSLQSEDPLRMNLSCPDRKKITLAYLENIRQHGYLAKTQRLLQGKLPVTLTPANIRYGNYYLRLIWTGQQSGKSVSAAMHWVGGLHAFYIERIARKARSPKEAAALYLWAVEKICSSDMWKLKDIQKIRAQAAAASQTMQRTLQLP
jgi:hypothetical protein